MANLITRLRGGERSVPDISTVEDYVAVLNGYVGGFGGGIQQTLAGETTERAPNSFVGLAQQAYGSNGVVFACMLVRQLVFSSVRFRWQRLRDGKPSDTFGSADLSLLERPWVGGTTQDLLSRVIQDADLSGNSYWIHEDDQMVRLRPDWIDIVVQPRMMRDGRGQIGWKKAGYLYTAGGDGSGNDPVGLLPEEVAHFAPIPDPLANFRGMSWLTPILREIQADQSMTRHQQKFFDNGAPQPLDAKIMTPTGWSTMGAMGVGDRVIGSDGKPHDVVAVYPQGEKDIYRVTFSSGTSTECTSDHLWTVASAYDRKLGNTRTMTLAQIVDGGVTYQSGPAKWSVPLVAPIEFDDAGELPIAPYLLGSLLGDGCLRANAKGSGGVSLSAHADDVDEQAAFLSPLLPEGVRISRRDSGNWSTLSFARVNGGPKTNALTAAIKDLGLFDCIGHEKFVPERYMRASVTERVALLQGLLDTDGSIEKRQRNEVRFTNTSEALAVQVAELANGLGGLATVHATRAAAGNARPQWTARISRLPQWIVPVRLARKASMYRPTLRGGAYRYIQKVELVGRKQAQCIAVESDDHLYVTDDFILTHNTVNLVIKHGAGANEDKVRRFSEMMRDKHGGIENAYKTLHLYPGADATPVGSNLKDIDFKSVRGGGETRVAAAAGVPPVIVGLSEGLAAATYSNYGQARRRLADGTAHPLWQNIAGSMELIVPRPRSRGDGLDFRLWYDATDVPFLREDEKDAAEIAHLRAQTIRQLVDGGFTPESAVAAVDAGDYRLLVHSGFLSVQLQKPGTTSQTPASPTPTDDPPPET